MKTTHTKDARGLSHSWRNAAACCLLLLMALAASVRAQSTDRDNPTPLTTNEIRGAGVGKYVEYYYSFPTTPGEIKVTLDATSAQNAATSGGAEVEIFDEDANKLLNLFVLSGNGSSERKVERLQVRAQKTLVVKLKVGSNNDRYMARFEGSGIRLEKPPTPTAAAPSSSASASSGPTPAAMSAILQALGKLRYSYSFKNNTAFRIAGVFVAPSGADDLGENMLGGNILEPGMSLEVSMLKAGNYDIRTIDEQGGECVRRNVPIQKNLVWTISHSVHVNCVQASQ